MARLDYTRPGDVISQFLPNIYTRRITLEGAPAERKTMVTVQGVGTEVFHPGGVGGAGLVEDKLYVTVDTDIHDRLNNDGLGIIVGAKAPSGGVITEGEVNGRVSPYVDSRDKESVSAEIYGALRVAMVCVASNNTSADSLVREVFKAGYNMNATPPQRIDWRPLMRQYAPNFDWFNELNQDRLDAFLETNTAPNVPAMLKRFAEDDNVAAWGRSRIFADIHWHDQPARGDGRQYLEDIDLYRGYDKNNDVVHKIPFTHTFQVPKDSQYVSIYAFTYLDFNSLSLEHGFNESQNDILNSMLGRPSRNKILSGGKVLPYSRIFLDHKGTPWSGPHHRMEDGRFMKGRLHDRLKEGEDQYLTMRFVPNTKVQDFRSFKRFEEALYEPDFSHFLDRPDDRTFLANKRKDNFPANLNLVVDRGAGNNLIPLAYGEILIDQEHILRENSRFGDLYNFLPNATKFMLLTPRNYFRLRRLKLLRKRVTKRDLGINSLGYGAKDDFHKNADPECIAYSSEGPSWLTAMADPTYSAPGQAINLGYAEIDFSGRFDLLKNYPPDNDIRTAIIVDDTTERVLEDLRSAETTNFTQNPDPAAPSPDLKFPFRRTFHYDDGLIPTPASQDRYVTVGDIERLRYTPNPSQLNHGIYQYGIELTYEDSIVKYFHTILKRLQTQRVHLEKYYDQCLIPVTNPWRFGANFQSGEGIRLPPKRGGFIAEYDPGSSDGGFTRLGNWNSATKRFSDSFVRRVRENAQNDNHPEYNFALMASVYIEASSVIYAKTLAKIRDNNIPEPQEYRFLNIHEIVALLRPENSRPEQVSEILKSFNEIESLLEDMLGESKTYPGFGLPDKRTGLKDRGTAPPQTITVQKWFSDVDDYVDLNTIHDPVADYGIGMNDIGVSEFAYDEQDPNYQPPELVQQVGLDGQLQVPLVEDAGMYVDRRSARRDMTPEEWHQFLIRIQGQTARTDSMVVNVCEDLHRLGWGNDMPLGTHISSLSWETPPIVTNANPALGVFDPGTGLPDSIRRSCFGWQELQLRIMIHTPHPAVSPMGPGQAYNDMRDNVKFGLFVADLDGDGIYETEMVGRHLTHRPWGLAAFDAPNSGAIFYADIGGQGDGIFETVLVFESSTTNYRDSDGRLRNVEFGRFWAKQHGIDEWLLLTDWAPPHPFMNPGGNISRINPLFMPAPGYYRDY